MLHLSQAPLPGRTRLVQILLACCWLSLGGAVPALAQTGELRTRSELEASGSLTTSRTAQPPGEVAPPDPRLDAERSAVYARAAGGIDDLASGGPTFDMDEFERNLRDALDGQVAGYAYAINFKKRLARTGHGGFARRIVDGGVSQSAYKVMNIASISKTVTAVGLLMLLERAGISLYANVEPWLPEDWERGPGVTGLTFIKLMRHTTNIPGNTPYDWNGLQGLIEGGIPGALASYEYAPFQYSNANFALFRILIPAIWSELPDGPDIGDLDAISSRVWYMIYMQDHVFEPLGIDHALCMPDGDPDPTLYYNALFPAQNGAAGGDWQAWCGSGGWYLSAHDLNNLMAHIRYDESYFSASNRSRMESLFLGWMRPFDGTGYEAWVVGDHGTYLAHGGDLFFDGLPPGPFSREMHGCVMMFPIQVEVSLLINSSRLFTSYQCALLRDAFDAAWVD